MYFLSSDVGGTFVDLVLFDLRRNRLLVDKVSSTGESAEGILRGVRRILAAAGISIDKMDRFVHGTTIATNTWLTRRGAKVAFLVTDGFCDVLEIATQRRPQLHSLTQQRPPALVSRSQAVEVRERVDAFGEVVLPLRKSEIARVVEAVQDLAPESVALSLLFSFLNDAHETALAEAIQECMPNVPVYRSTEINPQIEEYPRANTTVAAAYVGPRFSRYIDSLEKGLKASRFTAPLMLMRSDGGVATPQAARRNPVTMLLSGPAGGVIAAARLSEAIDVPNMITFDMGGTSADFSLIVGGKPGMSNERSVHDQAIRVPMLDIETISAGGGSIASVDHAGALRVGPQSAGSTPGPACYGQGGSEPTLTDAAVVLGIIDPLDFAGGDISLNPGAARQAIELKVAKPLGIPVEAAALGMISVACAQMRQAIRALSVERGHDIRDFSLLAFGGAGPIFAALMELDLGIEQVLVPPRPGVFAAFGLLLADIKHNIQAPFSASVNGANPSELRSKLEDMGQVLDRALEMDGVAPSCRSLHHFADLRYEGQFHDIAVPLRTPGEPDWWDPKGLVDLFHRLHDQTYGHSDRESAVEIINIRTEASGKVEKPTLPKLSGRLAGSPTPSGTRRVMFERTGGWQDCPVYARDELLPEDAVAGPAIVSQTDTTTLILPGQMGRVDDCGVIHIRRGEAD